MDPRDIIVIGASPGDVEALKVLSSQLPVDLHAAIFVVVHIPSQATSVLPKILTRAGPLPAVHPRDGETFHSGKIYIAPPNHHMSLEDGKINAVDSILPVSDIATKIEELPHPTRSIGGKRMAGRVQEKSRAWNESEGTQLIWDDVQSFENGAESPLRTIISCLGCGGVLWEIENWNITRYECQIGHVYNRDSLLTEQGDLLETALWSAVRILEQPAALTARMAAQSYQSGHKLSADRFRKSSNEAERNAAIGSSQDP